MSGGIEHLRDECDDARYCSEPTVWIIGRV